MAENYKHLYEQTKKMLTMYQDELIPGYRKQIEDLEAKSKWIPVTERLPSDCGEDWVLAFVVEDTGYKLIPKVAEYRKELGDWYCVDLGWLGQDHHGAFIVTHWMPLPEPPKGVD